VDEHAAVAGLAREAVLDLEAIVPVGRLREQVSLGLAHADQHAVADDEAVASVFVGVLLGHVGLPSREILAVEELDHAIGDDGRLPAGCLRGGATGGERGDGGEEPG